MYKIEEAERCEGEDDGKPCKEEKTEEGRTWDYAPRTRNGQQRVLYLPQMDYCMEAHHLALFMAKVASLMTYGAVLI